MTFVDEKYQKMLPGPGSYYKKDKDEKKEKKVRSVDVDRNSFFLFLIEFPRFLQEKKDKK